MIFSGRMLFKKNGKVIKPSLYGGQEARIVRSSRCVMTRESGHSEFWTGGYEMEQLVSPRIDEQ